VDFRIVTESPSWFIVFCLLAGLACSALLYRRDRLLAEAKAWLRYFMAVLRFLAVALLAFLLLTPLVKSVTRRVDKPVIVFAQDNSHSAAAGLDSAARTAYAATVRRLTDDLSGDFEVRTFSFGEKVATGLPFTFTDRETDLSGLFDELDLRFMNRNVGAVIVASDGLYNRGNNPVYSRMGLGVPVFTVAMGDSAVHKDLVLGRVNHNRVAFLGNTIPMEVLVDARQCAGDRSVLTIRRDSTEVFRKELAIHGNRFHLKVPVYIDGAVRGINRYDVSLQPVAGEISTLNNATAVFVEVTEKKQPVVLVAAGPHPDLAAIRSVVETSLHYELVLQWASSFNPPPDAGLVIVYQLPSYRNAAPALLARLRQSGIPQLYILGGQTDVETFNGLQTGLSISRSNRQLTDALPQPVESFSLFTVDDGLRNLFRTLPPLKAPFGEYRSVAGPYPMLNQKIGAVETGQPLLVFYPGPGPKTGVLCGEGFWKWRLHDFQANGSHDLTNAFFLKVVQYLATRDVKTPFRILFKSNYAESERLVFNAELYDESGELINEPEVKLTLRNDQNREFEYTFSRTAKGYQLDAGSFPAGTYRFRATTRSGDQVYRQDGEFSISPLQAELTETTANHQLLYSLSDRTGGTMVYPADAGSLADAIRKQEEIKPVIYTERKLKDLINLKWFFFVLAGLLSVEWFLRKRSGAY